jgi:predicted Ser/Thr protein kinase
MAGDGERSDDQLARTATAPGSKDAPVLGNTLGRYRLERELGAGGMGVVHAAFDPDLERRVALKVLRSEGGEARQRLLREARALARLTHPNVVTVHEVGSATGRDYVAMELIEGETLADWLKAAPRTHAEVVAAFTAAGRGLAAAHAAGLVHRDFKPHNVLRRKDGRIVVTDFGLARGIEVAIEFETTIRAKGPKTDDNTPSPLTGLTETGSVLGTPAYMAPEQWTGGTIGPAADQFAFCVALWEALAGERPFRGATLEALQADVKRGPSELDDSKLPRRLRAPLKRGLDPDPARRWPNMDALIAAIARSERPRGLLLVIGSSAVVATAVAYAVLPTDDKPTVAAPTCEQPALEPSAVWSPAIANQVRDKTSSEIMRHFDATMGSWQAARSVACSLDTPKRARRLGCLDGVIARFDAVRKAAIRGVKPTLDDIGGQLLDPGVCNVDDPPRLPAKLSDAAAAALALSYQPDPTADYDDKREAEALRVAGDDPCARAFVRVSRAEHDDSSKARDAAEEAVQLADTCGDDRTRADALISLLGMQITMFLDPKLQKALAAAESAVRKVAQPDLVARLDLVKSTIAMVSGQWDEAVKLTDSAMRGFGEHQPMNRIAAVEVKARALRGRHQKGDLKAARADLARWRPQLERLDDPAKERALVGLDMLDAGLQWATGDVAGANARFPALHERQQRLRKPPKEVGETITGLVTDRKGTPVADALVVASPVIAADSVSIGFLDNGTPLARTDAQGRFTLQHVDKAAIIVAEHGDLRSRVRNARNNDRLVLEPTTTISGRVAGPDAEALILFVVDGNASRSTMYQMLAPIAPDGSFTLAHVPVGKLRIGASRLGSGMGQAFSMQDVVVGANGRTDLVVQPANARKLRVVARSAIAVPLSGATVIVVSGSITLKSAKDVNSVLRSPGVAIEVARPVLGEPPPEVGKLLPGDLLATLTNAPAGSATACAFGFSGDMSDPEYRKKVFENLEKLEVRCVPVAPDATTATIEVPPMKRID